MAEGSGPPPPMGGGGVWQELWGLMEAVPAVLFMASYYSQILENPYASWVFELQNKSADLFAVVKVFKQSAT